MEKLNTNKSNQNPFNALESSAQVGSEAEVIIPNYPIVFLARHLLGAVKLTLFELIFTSHSALQKITISGTTQTSQQSIFK